MHLELLALQRRIQGRVTLPMLDLSPDTLRRHQTEARPLLRFEDIPLDLSDLRLLVRQTADVLRRFGALDQADYDKAQTLGRDMQLLATVGSWYRARAERQLAVAGVAAMPGRRSGRRHRARSGDRARHASVPLAMRRSASAASRTGELDARALRAVRRRARSRRHYAVSRTSPDLRTMLAAMEVRVADVSLLPQQRPVDDHVVCDDRRQVSRLRVRRLSAVSEGVRRPPRDQAGDADRRQRRHVAARCGGNAAGIYVVTGN